MAYQVEVLVAKPKDQTLILGTHVVVVGVRTDPGKYAGCSPTSMCQSCHSVLQDPFPASPRGPPP